MLSNPDHRIQLVGEALLHHLEKLAVLLANGHPVVPVHQHPLPRHQRVTTAVGQDFSLKPGQFLRLQGGNEGLERGIDGGFFHKENPCRTVVARQRKRCAAKPYDMEIVRRATGIESMVSENRLASTKKVHSLQKVEQNRARARSAAWAVGQTPRSAQ